MLYAAMLSNTQELALAIAYGVIALALLGLIYVLFDRQFRRVVLAIIGKGVR